MKVQFQTLVLLALIAAFSIGGCKNNLVSTGAPVTAVVTGLVVGSASPSPLAGVTVVLSHGGSQDSVLTGSDGIFQFILDVPDTINGVDITLTVRKTGYITKTISSKIKRDQSFPVGLEVDPSAYSIVTGTVRDSSSSYPLGGASVLVSLPANSSIASKFLGHVSARRYSVSSFIVDSTTTCLDGSFSMNINLFDLDSITATMIISKPGFLTYQKTHTFTRGANNFGTVPLAIDNSQSYGHITGQVTDGQTSLPLTNVQVVMSTSLRTDTVMTLADGSYSFDVNLQGLSSTAGTLLFKLNSYQDFKEQFTVNAGQTLTENVALTAQQTVVGGDSSSARGVARSFSLISAEPTEIAVDGVGGTESSTLIWQVLDSLGLPIDITHQDTVYFQITGAPVQGGAYVTPSSALTDGAGRVSTKVHAGTVAGPIQVVAWLKREPTGEIIQASPVLLIEDGGFPDQAHFSFGVGKVNFAGYDWVGRTDNILVQAGDKYGNPVHPNTAIYFTSTGGGIATAPGYTNSTGQASATLYSGDPLPRAYGLDSTLYGSGIGYGWVKAVTQGENGTVISDSALVLFSASSPRISLNGAFNQATGDTIHSGGSISIPVTISDRFGNPLESGTTIAVSVKVPPQPTNSNASWSVDWGGDLPSVLGDFLTRGPLRTEFTLTLSGSEVGTNQPVAFTATITVSGPNGTASNSVTGTLLP